MDPYMAEVYIRQPRDHLAAVAERQARLDRSMVQRPWSGWLRLTGAVVQ